MYSELAKKLVESMECLASNENAKNNFISYLTQHFPSWLKKYASCPEDLVSDIDSFAHMFNNE